MFNSVSCTTSGMQDRVGLGMIHLMILTVSQVHMIIREVVSIPLCQSGQKLRQYNGYNICCYTTSCERSQKFKFCTRNQEYDVCVDCPPNYFTNDPINTSQWEFETDICVPKPQCNPEETMVGYTCQCDLARGYFGSHDRCLLDDKCKVAGYQVQSDGSCIRCDNDHFKPEEGTHGICQPKRICKVDEIQINPGSITVDRTCLKINVTTTTIQTTVPLPTDSPKPGGHIEPWVIAVIVLVCVGLVALVLALLYVFCIRGNRHRYRLQGNLQLSDLLNRCRLRNRTAGGNQVQELLPMITPSYVVIPNGTNANGSVSENGSPVNHPATGNEDMVDGQSYQTGSVEDDLLADPKPGSESLMGSCNNSSQTIPKIVAHSSNENPSEAEQFPPFSGNSLFKTSDSFSYIKQKQDASCTIDPDSTEEKSLYFTTDGNIPNMLLLGSLNTLTNPETTDTFNTARSENLSPVESQVNEKSGAKKTVPMAAVPPTFRPEPRGNGVSSTDRSDTDPASPTTASGLDVQQATIEGNDKLVATNAPYGELQVDMTGRFPNDETSGSADTEETLSTNSVTESETGPLMRHLPPTTLSGQLLMSPESDGSYDHSTNDSSEPQIVDRESTENNQPDLNRENMQ